MPSPTVDYRKLGLHFEDIVARIKMVTDAETHRDVCSLLDMSAGNFNRNLEFDTIPMPRVIMLALRKGLSLDFLLTGTYHED